MTEGSPVHLSARMLAQAKTDLRGWRPEISVKSRPRAIAAFRSAVEWVFAPDSQHALDFETVCANVGILPEEMQKRFLLAMSEWQREEAEKWLNSRRKAA